MIVFPALDNPTRIFSTIGICMCARCIVFVRVTLLTLVFVVGWFSSVQGQSQPKRFSRLVLSEQFHSEGADVADINGDGINDIVSGPFWYSGPDYRKRYAYAPVKDYAIKGYSDHFFAFARDFDGDGHTDIFTVPIPGQPGVWYENPATDNLTLGESADWKMHVALPSVDNESPTFADVTGDGIEELVCIHNGAYGYAAPDKDDPYQQWEFIPMTPDRAYGRFTHGLGVGDVDGDGRNDLLEKDGWWQQTESEGQLFQFHAMRFAQSGGSQMFAYDFDGDGDQDVLSVQNAHAYGLTWFERRGAAGEFSFLPHLILGETPTANPYGLAISQMHAMALVDIDGDGVKDIVTGKRFWAHGGKDPGATQLPVLYWFRTVRSQYGVEFQPHLISKNVGVGTQLTATDIDQDGNVDLVVGNKLGTSVLMNLAISERQPTPTDSAPHLVGTDEFKTTIRTTDPLSAEDERQSFVLPPGFEIQLVASEPDIAKPMNMAFDPKGRLWVTSSSEYPYPAKEGEGRDTVKILEDTNHDGRMDKITTFADKLNIPIGLYPYRDGVICYSIPNIWHLRDTDGDGKCDTREVLYGPFDYSRDTHGLCNGFTRGSDGWLYACHGFNNQSSVAGKDGHRVTLHSGNTFRMRLDGSRIEKFTDGQVNPFGMSIDTYGDLFTADCHTKPVSLLMKGGVYPGFGKPHDGLGFVPDVMNHLHGSTAIGGIALYHDGVFPAVYDGNAFGGNVMTGRVNRNSIHHDGGTVSAREESDFLISDDPWFRPVDLQVGPDGALYVADFYNRIIGHYEVGLDHPGRDRHRGRIWRIAFAGGDERRDVEPKSGVAPNNGPAEGIVAAIGRLKSPRLTQRMLAADELADQHGDAAIKQVRAATIECKNSNQLIQLTWILNRLDAITENDLVRAAKHASTDVRVHAMKIAANCNVEEQKLLSVLIAGLGDRHPEVRRAAALALAGHVSLDATKQLMTTLRRTPSRDLHLTHAIRMSLRDHLSDAEHFELFTADLAPEEVSVVSNLCLGIKTDFAGEFLAAHVADLDGLSQEKLSTYLSFAARYAAEEHLDSIATMAQSRFAGDLRFQEQLARSIRDGLVLRGNAIPESISHWAEMIARQYLGMNLDSDSVPDQDRQFGWTFSPDPKTLDSDNPWVLSTRRNSSDGQKGSKLHSSFPKGESKTGVYRSDRFALPGRLSFYIAGHDGVPGKPIQGKNLVRVRDGATGRIIETWSPPRNDTAQRVAWETGDLAGQDAYFELVDGDTARAYAWIAVGRFSVSGLNPSRVPEQRRNAAKLIADFKLTGLRQPIRQLVADSSLSGSTLVSMIKTLVAFDPSSALSAVAESLPAILGQPDLLRGAVSVILDRNVDLVPETLGRAMQASTATQQLRIASVLASDEDGVAILIGLVESGKASARLLIDPSLADRLAAVANEDLSGRRAKLIEGLPAENELLTEVLKARVASFRNNGGNETEGAKLFTKNCAVCHQVAGKGVAVGPNLDGIGNRGLDRVIEDLMMPNRNIDTAFRASVVLTEDGQVHSGLVKRTDGTQIVIVDQTGKEISVSEDEISRQQVVRTSPMPANFHETFNDDQTRDLLSYLLSLTH